MDNIKPRWFQRNLQAALRVLPVSVLTGARQTGKTTLTQIIEPARPYLTLDDVGVLDQAERNPDALLSTRPVILDEVQRAPQLLLAVKRAVDARRHAGDFILTGSANLLLMKHVADTLAGRAIYLELPPFCPTEWQGRKDALAPLDRLFAADFDWRDWPDETGDWPTWLLRGGFPPALQIDSEPDRGLWFAAYIQTYLERDLRQLSAVSSLPDFQRIMALAAQRTGKLLNQADLARDAALSHPTAHRYLNLLETGCLITRVRPLATNLSGALVKAPKLLWADCGLAASLAGIKSSAAMGCVTSATVAQKALVISAEISASAAGISCSCTADSRSLAKAGRCLPTKRATAADWSSTRAGRTIPRARPPATKATIVPHAT